MKRCLVLILIASLFSCKEENSFQGYHIDTNKTVAKDICVVDIDKDGDLDSFIFNM